ncbi:winged helix-turn-helix transcriptional regulator [Hoeflea poritis]|uniref:Helix-turn-helix domain-containing protein n=1 Tax=Hoeflea poritis TaxID=2993659 RepID=A0ABT4VRT6_9HYPH|nr:helix-turn-helix domain-containing protein [Hoeflea poritis]MDA4847420.1 helix-turn-helix domain-containing protein [Hoeflea poritis]
MRYGQFCPIAKSLELIGDRWTILVLREVLMGGRRYNEIQRGLGGISSALLSKRLKWLVECGLLDRMTKPGTNVRYFPTKSALELQPVLMALGNWGMKWTQSNLSADDYDVELLMLYLERSIDLEGLLVPRIVVRFEFVDLAEQRLWWVIAEPASVEICTTNPEFDVDVFLTVPLGLMTNIWLGHDSYRRAESAGELILHGNAALVRNIESWLRCSEFSPQPKVC